MIPAWCTEWGVVVVDDERRIPICNSHGRPDAALAGQLVALHNSQLQQLRDDMQATALDNERLKRELAQAEETRTAAQAEATRQLVDRREFSYNVRKALRVGSGADVLAAIYRLQRLADAFLNVARAEGWR